MATQCATATVLFGAGDIIAQQTIEKRGVKGHDVRGIASANRYVSASNCIAGFYASSSVSAML